MSIDRILIVKFWAMGDVVMATPMIDALRHYNPDIHIVWLVDTKNYDLLKNIPQIDCVIPIDTAQWRKQLKKGDLLGWLRSARQFYRQMRDFRLDAVINCHPDKWWTVVFCCAPLRVALYPFAAPLLSRSIYTTSISRPTNPGVHNTIHYLLATRALGITDGSLAMTVGNPSQNGNRAPSSAVSGRRQIVVAPFSTAENRNWPPERYVALIDWLVSEHNADVIIVASSQQTADVDRLISDLNSEHVTRADQLSVDEYIEIIRSSNLVISGDSSPMHLSAAVGVPFVALFGATPVGERAPLQGRGVSIYKPVECSPCDRGDCTNSEFRKCMNQISVEDVRIQVNAMLLPVQSGDPA